MGFTTISNGKLTAVIADKGAELQSLTYNGIEYIWQADKAFWGKHAPVLFPFVGRCKYDSYTYAGTPYAMGQHGFARDNVFERVNYSDNSVTFLLQSTPKLLERYPFDFKFFIEFRIMGDTLEVNYTVRNTGNKMMFFSVGSHEAYRCPLVDGECFEDYKIYFNRNERLERYFLEDGLVSRTGEPFVDMGQPLMLNHADYYKSAAVLKDVKSDCVTLKSDVSGHGLKVSFPGFKNLGIWQAKDAPFIAIEPWNGISDSVDFNADLPLKKDIMRLNCGADYKCTHSITVF